MGFLHLLGYYLTVKRGKDFDTHIEKKARALKKIQKVEEKYGVKLTTPKPEKPKEPETEEDLDDEERTLLQIVRDRQ